MVRHIALNGTSWTEFAKGSVRSSPMLNAARNIRPINVDPKGV